MVEEEDNYSPEEEEEKEQEGNSGGELLERGHSKKKRVNFVGENSGMRGTATATDAGGTVASPASAAGCQAEKCKTDLTDSKRYHKKHKVCEYHAKAQVVLVAGQRQRFCQQCSRFHELSEFDEAKRSCRRRLAGHNERRRKHFPDSHGVEEGGVRTNAAIRKIRCRQVDQKGRTRTPIAFPQRHQNFDIH